jgi:hypothetical protein
LVYALFSFAYGYGFKYLILLFYVNLIVSQLQSSSNLILLLSTYGGCKTCNYLTHKSLSKIPMVGSVDICR